MPHAQAKSHTSASPADLTQFLAAANEGLAANPINIEGISGSNVEAEGELHFTVEHGREAEVHAQLERYHPEWTTDVYVEEIPPGPPDPNQPGVLHGIIQRATDEHPDRTIDTVLIGALTGSPGVFYVQVTFTDSVWTAGPPEPEA